MTQPMSKTLVLLTTLTTAAAQAATDCSLREQGYGDPTGPFVQASDYAGGCIPASDFANWSMLELDDDAILCADDRPFNMTVYLSTDGVSFDCNDQTIAHDRGGRHRGVRTPYTYSVSNIRVANCTFQSVRRYGVDLKRFFRGEQLEGPMEGHRDIVLEDLRINSPGQIGIYVGQNSRRVTIRNVAIDRGFSGIYIEAGSAGVRITNATITNSREREGISIDSSHHNIVENSRFEGNGDAINLYKNCGEPNGQVCPIRRPDGASYNILRNNEFRGDDVNVAWRQFKLYGPDRCAGIRLAGYWRDRSSHNLLDGNRFSDGAVLDVQDEGNAVVGNRFYDSLFEIGAGDPIGDDPIEFFGYVTGNIFDERSWIAVEGSVSGVFDHLELIDNSEPSGACRDTFRQRAACGPGSAAEATSFGCFFSPRKIPRATVCGGPRATLWTHFSTGSRFALQSSFQRMAYFWDHQRWLVGDFDGDGKDDVVNVYNAWNDRAHAWVHLSTGAGFEFQSSLDTFAGFWQAQKWRVGDFDGDGKDDLVNIYGKDDKARVWVHLSTGSGFEAKSSFQTLAGFWEGQRWLVGDFNGDGKDDLVNVYGNPDDQARAWVHRSTGSGFEAKSSFQTLAGFWEGQQWLVGDFNGDGKDDLVNVYGDPDDQARAWIHRSTGSEFEARSSLQTLASFWQSQRWLAGDFDGDGRDDLVSVYANPENRARAWIHRSTGSRFELQSSLQTLADFWYRQRWVVGDFNGDGRDDLLNVYPGAD